MREESIGDIFEYVDDKGFAALLSFTKDEYNLWYNIDQNDI